MCISSSLLKGLQFYLEERERKERAWRKHKEMLDALRISKLLFQRHPILSLVLHPQSGGDAGMT